MNRPVMIMAGGTGGHIFPGLAVARSLEHMGVPVIWMGSRHGMEQDVVTAHGIELESIDVRALRGKGIGGLLLAPWRLLRSLIQSIRVLRRHRPRSVLSMGGFVAGPGGLGAWMSRIPLIVHEQNSVPGLTNRLLSKLARRVLCGFPDVLSPRGEFCGNPVRQDIIDRSDDHDSEHDSGPLKLLVVGGSLGAEHLNRVVPQSLALMDSSTRPQVLHQTGRGKQVSTQADYKSVGVEAEVTEFIDDMSAAYVRADLVICRSGALTVSELATIGRPAIFVPYPHAVDDHQTTNAMVLVNAGAAQIMQQSVMTAAGLAGAITQLNEQPGQLKEMGLSARSFSRPGAADHIAGICCQEAA